MNKAHFLLPALALVLAGAGCTASTNVDVTSTDESNGTNTTYPADATTDTNDDEAATEDDGAVIEVDAGVEMDTEADADEADDAASVSTFTVTGSNFAFSPANLSVKKGDTVNITFSNSSGTHDFNIDEFAVATFQLEGGASQTVSFVADKTGSFEYYCSVGSHRSMGMTGTLTVTE